MLSSNSDRDELVPDPVVWRELGITPMTGWRWTNDPDLDFPPQIKIRNRNFRSRKQFEAFKRRLILQATHERSRARRSKAHPDVTRHAAGRARNQRRRKVSSGAQA
jgi:hypothetical protein